MRLKHYLRGLGLGIIVTTLIVSAGKRGSAAELTDEEIKVKARALGMVEEDELLLSQAQDLAKEAAENDDAAKKAQENPDSDSASVNSGISADSIISGNVSAGTVSDGGISSNFSANRGEDGLVMGSFKGAGAESAFETGPKSEKEKAGEEKNGEEKPLNKEEVNSDAGRGGSAEGGSLKKTSSSDKKDTSSSDKKKDTSSSDRKTTSSSDKKPETVQTAADSPATEGQPVETPAPQTEPASETAPEPAPQAAPGAVTIVKGESSTTVARKLQQAGIIQDAMQFDQYLCLNGYDRRLVTGDHTIPAGASAREIAEIITKK